MIKMELAKIKDALSKINTLLTKKQKTYGLIVLLTTLVCAALETLGVSAILPVVEALVDIEGLKKKWYVAEFIRAFDINDNRMLIAFVSLGVIFIYVIKNLFFIFQNWISKKYCYKVKRELGSKVMKTYMQQGYIFFVNNNSSVLLQGLSGDVSNVYGVINSLFVLSSKSFTILAIAIFIMLKSPLIAIVLLLLAGLCIFLVQLIYRKPMRVAGEALREASWENTQATLEAIHGSKEILVAGKQDFFVKKYIESLIKHNSMSIKVEMATITPTYLIEMVCVTGILMAVITQMGENVDAYSLIGDLSVIAVAAFRILPCVGAVTSSVNSIMSNMPSFNMAYRTLQQVDQLEQNITLLQDKSDLGGKVTLKKKIELVNISYKYPDTSEYVLKDINLLIDAKTSIGIMGASGAGKSTLVDILLGLLVPQKGRMLLDDQDISKMGKAWNRIVGYVPQSIYLIDATIRENIAFGVPKEEIDDEQIWKVLEMSQMIDFVKKQPKQLDTIVGEWGIKFSGGQRQRLAIARALYNNPEILVLDEATAALDNDTENAVMEAIENLQGEKTLIVVAHRLSTIRQCGIIYEVKEGNLIKKRKDEIFSIEGSK